MKRVIILSDTHGLLRPEVVGYLSQADIIIHGGDINTQAIVDKLREYAPIYIVRGNNDKDWAEGLPQSLIFSI
ncbi:MJ0936 family phosphodiesterase [Oscillibacter sp. 1-3]|nr:MJ0936 family phosphodiesterase [Oscillibacter sp. 1-3]